MPTTPSRWKNRYWTDSVYREKKKSRALAYYYRTTSGRRRQPRREIRDGTIRCNVCQNWKLLENFSIRKATGYPRWACKPCCSQITIASRRTK